MAESVSTADRPRSLTVRLDPRLYASATALARKRRKSLNALVQDSLVAAIRSEADREMYEAASLLGADSGECDVEYALLAQAEVLQLDER